MVDATSAPAAVRSSNVDALTVAASTGSLNVAVTFAAVPLPIEPFAGDVPVTHGGVVSAPLVVNTTSTQ